MTPGRLSKRVVGDRLAWIERMVQEIRSLPLENKEAFFADRRNVWTAESCLRRALEALFDLGRHIMAKGFAQGASEYKEIAIGLKERGGLSPAEAEPLRALAGYRNRLVHFYREVPPEELYEVCAYRLTDRKRVADGYRRWLGGHPQLLDETL